MTRRHCLIAAEVLFALLGFSALVTEIATLAAKGRFNAGDFFSYFTVEANSLTVISLLVGACAVAARHESTALDFFRGAVTLYMTTTILIFIVLLSGYPSEDLTAVPWDNTVLHYIMPIVMMVDWLIAPRFRPVPISRSFIWLAFPLAYLFYSLIRGSIVGWYPYPFMNPSTHGWAVLVITSLVIAVVLTAIAAAIAAVSKVNLAARLYQQHPSTRG
jgi:hypothetical protein